MWLDLQKLSLTAQEMNPIYCWLLNLHSYTNIKHITIDDQVCFHWRLIANPVVSPWYNTGFVGSANGINKDVTGARLRQTTVSTCPVNWVPFYNLLKTQHCCLCPYGKLNLPPATYPPLHPLHPPSTYPPLITCHLWYYSHCEKLLKTKQC